MYYYTTFTKHLRFLGKKTNPEKNTCRNKQKLVTIRKTPKTTILITINNSYVPPKTTKGATPLVKHN